MTWMVCSLSRTETTGYQVCPEDVEAVRDVPAHIAETTVASYHRRSLLFVGWHDYR